MVSGPRARGLWRFPCRARNRAGARTDASAGITSSASAADARAARESGRAAANHEPAQDLRDPAWRSELEPRHLQRSDGQPVSEPPRPADAQERPEGDDGRGVAKQAARGAPGRLPARDLRPHAEDAEGHVGGRLDDEGHERRYADRDEAATGHGRQFRVSGDQGGDPGDAEYTRERVGSGPGDRDFWRRRLSTGSRRRSAAESVRAAGRFRRGRWTGRGACWWSWARRPAGANGSDVAAATARQGLGLRELEYRERAGETAAPG